MTRKFPKEALMLAVGLLSVLPVFVFADSVCPNLSRNLSTGSSGTDVLALQKFLNNQGDLFADSFTGYFGSVTQTGVKRWQADNHIVSSGSATSTGWGAVGPKTRAAIAAFCAPGGGSGSWATNGPSASEGSTVSGSIGASTSNNTSSLLNTVPGSSAAGTCPLVSYPQSACTTGWQGVRGTNGCIHSWFCIAPFGNTHAVSSTSTVVSSNGPITIYNMSGPSVLNAGDTGTWSVSAADSLNSSLTYGFSWDDGNSAFDQIASIAQTSTTAPSASHQYNTPGVYSVSITVKDTLGNSAVTSMQVWVGSYASLPSTTSSGQSSGTSSGTSSGINTTPASTTSWTNATGGYTCTAGAVQYFSLVPCPWNGTSSTSTSGTNNFGSSSYTATLGGLCAIEGQQEFLACSFTANCMGGGTYLVCRNGIWVQLQSSATDRLSDLANALQAFDAALKAFLGH